MQQRFRATSARPFGLLLSGPAFRHSLSSVDLSVRSCRLLGTTAHSTLRSLIVPGTIGPFFLGLAALAGSPFDHTDRAEAGNDPRQARSLAHPDHLGHVLVGIGRFLRKEPPS